MHKWFGNAETFAIEYIGEDSGLVMANLFVSGQNITQLDNNHYDQFLVHGAMGKTSRKLLDMSVRRKDHEPFHNKSLEHIFSNLWHDEPWCDYSVFDWVPCTSHFRCAIIFFAAQIYLCCARHEFPDQLFPSVVCLNSIAGDLQAARQHVVANTSSPFLKLESH